MSTYIIQDWAGNHKFTGQEFTTFEDAWEFLYTQDLDEDELGEFYVILKDECMCLGCSR